VDLKALLVLRDRVVIQDPQEVLVLLDPLVREEM